MRGVLVLVTARLAGRTPPGDLREARPAAAAPLRACLVPPTVDVPDGAKCASTPQALPLGPGSARAVELDMMLGEAEHFQLLVEADAEGPVQLTPPQLSAGGEPVQFRWHELGYVELEKTPRYEASTRSGFWPDPLLDPQLCVAGPERSAVLWVRAKAPLLPKDKVDQARAASRELWLSDETQNLEVSVGAAKLAVPVRVRVWPVQLPGNVGASVTQYWNYRGLNKKHEHLYDESAPGFGAIEDAFHDTLAENRIPATDFSHQVDVNVADDPSAQDERGDMEPHWRYAALHTPFVSLRLHPEPPCGTTDPQAVEAALDQLAPTVAKAAAFLQAFNAGRSDPRHLALYTYDEAPPSCLKTLDLVLSSVKRRWPAVVTISPLNWATPDTLPLDVQAVQYDKYVGALRAHGLARQEQHKRTWLYHCVEPHSSEYMNTFIESPLAGSRLLFWLAAVQPEVSGWLYWSSASWLSCPSGRRKPHPRKTPLERRLEHGKATSHVDFDAGEYWVCDNPQYSNSTWTNGDGFVVYPGQKGPVESTRLHAIRDGIEDLELLRLAPGGQQIAQKLVQGPTDWHGPRGPTYAAIRAVRLEALASAARALPPAEAPVQVHVAVEPTRAQQPTARASPETDRESGFPQPPRALKIGAVGLATGASATVALAVADGAAVATKAAVTGTVEKVMGALGLGLVAANT